MASNDTHLLSYSLGIQKFDKGLAGIESECTWGVFLWNALEGEPISLPFPASRGYPHSMAHGPSLHLPVSTVISPLTLPPSSTLKNPYDYIAPT